MPAERYFIEDSFTTGKSYSLEGSELHHLARVMRTRVGESIELVNGQGQLAQAIVQDIKKEEAIVTLTEVEIATRRSQTVILAQAIPKLNRLDFILEKGTELGVDEFWLFPGAHSVKADFSSNQLERMQAMILAAMKQCGRLFLPTISLKPALQKWPALTGTAFFGDTDENAPLFSQAWEKAPHPSPIIFFVGPESGLTDKEVQELKHRGVQGVKLHPNILRTDTAPLVALSLIEHWLLQSKGE